jgi:hypothetical protein
MDGGRGGCGRRLHRRPIVDDLTPGGLVNPFWCTYGTAPNAAYLIRTTGAVHTVQTWFDAATMEAAIRTLLGR